MESVFEEWDSYAQRQTLKQREIDLKGIEKSAVIKIIALTGIRRAGKSSILILFHQNLMKQNKRAAYINLEDSRIKNTKDILDRLLKWFGDSGYLLLDEITSVHDWESWLARNHEMLKGKLNLIVSSSRRNLVIPNRPLRGRILSYEVYPLSFKEFLEFKGISIEKTTAGIGRLEKALNDYLVYGGFPEVVLIEDKTEKIKILNSYFRDIIGLDVAEIAKENITIVELFGKYIIESSHFSASKCLNFFKSLGYKIGKQSLLHLEKCSQESYLFFFSPIFSYNIKDRSQYPRKDYIGDTGLIYAVSGKKDMGKLFENAVYLELRRRIKLNEDINYWKNVEGKEVDFVIREGLKVREVMQVSYEMEDEKTKEREIQSLITCAHELKCGEGIVITKEKEGREIRNKIKITFIPLWKWLLYIR